MPHLDSLAVYGQGCKACGLVLALQPWASKSQLAARSYLCAEFLAAMQRNSGAVHQHFLPCTRFLPAF